jgi:hypothetical protein
MTVERKAGAGHGWWLRAGLLFLAFASLLVGPWAQFAPAWFWEGFPGFGRSWVSVDGPYNEHLVRDVGGLQLGMAVVCFAAFLRPGIALVRAAALASVAWQAPHLVYHLVHVGDLPTLGDRVAQSAGLVITLVVAVAVLVAAWRPIRASGEPSGSRRPAG